MRYINTIEDLKKILDSTQDFGSDELPLADHFKDIKKAVKRIIVAIKNKEEILICGDYDADGVVATTIIVDYFRNVLKYPIKYIIPDRFKDGYGLKPSLIEGMTPNVIITVDNGITAIEAAEHCKLHNIDLIITDHHTPKEILPDAYAIIDQKVAGEEYPFEGICGAQIAWLLCDYINRGLKVNYDMDNYLDILCIAVVADVMPLNNINKKIVREGLERLNNSQYPVLRLIKDYSKSNIVSSETIGFKFAPLINAIGRLKNSNYLVERLLAKDETLAEETFEYMVSVNDERKEIMATMREEAYILCDKDESAIVVASSDWHEGVVGITASDLVGKYEKPAIVMGYHNGIYKGSGRSLGNISLFQVLCDIDNENPGLFIGFGGHKEACGLALRDENLETFKKLFYAKIKETYTEADYFMPEQVLGTINPDLVNLETLELIETYEPFGNKNPLPKFILDNSLLFDVRTLSEDKHLKIKFESKENVFVDGLMWNYKNVINDKFEVLKNKNYDLTFKLTKNEFNGRVTPQVIVENIKDRN